MGQSTKGISAKQIIAAAMKLPPKLKVKLAEELLESVEPLNQPEIDHAWVIEVRRRLRDVQEGKAHTIPAEEAFRSIDARLKP
jgi:putative addiction module component (TIGR02574 family)